jgi:hypothetical protein
VSSPVASDSIPVRSRGADESNGNWMLSPIRGHPRRRSPRCRTPVSCSHLGTAPTVPQTPAQHHWQRTTVVEGALASTKSSNAVGESGPSDPAQGWAYTCYLRPKEPTEPMAYLFVTNAPGGPRCRLTVATKPVRSGWSSAGA